MIDSLKAVLYSIHPFEWMVISMGVVFFLFFVRIPEKKEVAASPSKPDAEKKVYTRTQLLKDLENPMLTLEEILERCGGEIPKEESAEAPPNKNDRSKERLQWFQNVCETVKTLKVVPPPPPPQPVAKIDFFVVPCGWCTNSNMRSTLYGSTGKYRCDRCKDTGMIRIAKG